MTVREETEALEAQFLSPSACLAAQSRGRRVPVEPCPVRTCFQRDTDRIVHSKAFRRLKHKTQVFLQPEGDHYRTRMTHTLEVSRIARTIARGLRLNEDLTTWGTPPSATPESGCWTKSCPAALPTTSSPSAWWTGWKRTAMG